MHEAVDYARYRNEVRDRLAETDSPFESGARRQTTDERKRRKQPTKLGYLDQRELDRLPDEIADIEARIAELQQRVSEPGFYAQDRNEVQTTLTELADSEALLEARVERWSELEQLRESFL